MKVKDVNEEDGVMIILDDSDKKKIKNYLEDIIGDAYEPLPLAVTKLALWSGRESFGRFYQWLGKNVSNLVLRILDAPSVADYLNNRALLDK